MKAETEQPDDETLAGEVQAGSMSAFEELVNRYEARVYRFVSNCGCTQADAQEVTQDTFVRAFQAIARFDTRRSFATWLFTIARRGCIDRHRATSRAAAEMPPDPPGPQDPSELLAERETGERLWAIAKRCLPDIQFHALWLKYAEDMGVAEVGRVLAKTRTHVKVLLFRARNTLAKELEKEATRSGDAFESSRAKVSLTGTRDLRNDGLSCLEGVKL